MHLSAGGNEPEGAMRAGSKRQRRPLAAQGPPWRNSRRPGLECCSSCTDAGDSDGQGNAERSTQSCTQHILVTHTQCAILLARHSHNSRGATAQAALPCKRGCTVVYAALAQWAD